MRRYWTAVLDGVPDDPVDYLMHMQPSQELIWQLGNKEVPDGIRILALMQQDSIFGTLISVVAVEGALLGCACLVTFLYLWILQPYLKNTAEEVERTAKLLSQLPAAMNVETMLGEMLDIHSQDMTQSSETLAIRCGDITLARERDALSVEGALLRPGVVIWPGDCGRSAHPHLINPKRVLVTSI